MKKAENKPFRAEQKEITVGFLRNIFNHLDDDRVIYIKVLGSIQKAASLYTDELPDEHIVVLE